MSTIFRRRIPTSHVRSVERPAKLGSEPIAAIHVSWTRSSARSARPTRRCAYPRREGSRAFTVASSSAGLILRSDAKRVAYFAFERFELLDQPVIAVLHEELRQHRDLALVEVR